VFGVKIPVIFVVVVYVATSLVNKDKYIICYAYILVQSVILMTDLVVAFVLLIFLLVLLCFMCCYRFSVNKDLYKSIGEPSVLCHCWLGGRKGIRIVKTEWWGAGVVICLERGVDFSPADATATHCLLLQQNPAWFYLSGIPAHRGSPGKRGR